MLHPFLREKVVQRVSFVHLSLLPVFVETLESWWWSYENSKVGTFSLMAAVGRHSAEGVFVPTENIGRLEGLGYHGKWAWEKNQSPSTGLWEPAFRSAPSLLRPMLVYYCCHSSPVKRSQERRETGVVITSGSMGHLSAVTVTLYVPSLLSQLHLPPSGFLPSFQGPTRTSLVLVLILATCQPLGDGGICQRSPGLHQSPLDN